MEECARNTDILIGFSWLRPVTNVTTVGLKRAEKHNCVNGRPYVVSLEAGVHYAGSEAVLGVASRQLFRLQKLWAHKRHNRKSDSALSKGIFNLRSHILV
jgi:hypothetical protein